MAEAALGYCKLCEFGDFRDPDIEGLIRDSNLDHIKAYGRHFPRGRESRKHWEIAMTLRAFRDLGVLREDAQVLGVGAGREATIFWLTNHVGRVFATDLYLTDDPWSATDSDYGMLVNPEWFYEGEWNQRRLVVQHMNGLDLRYEDESFDGIFSSSSVEHFGELEDVRRSIEELYRVLRPGGVLALSTEYRLEGPPPGHPGVLMFDASQLRSLFLDGLGWELADPLVTSISDETLRTEVDQLEAIADTEAGRENRHPHIVLRKDPHLWTSVHLALIKTS
jgi:SAM-dependent methyltransferase